MCKLFAAAGIKPEFSELTWRLLEAMAPNMYKYNDDGFGYAAITGSELWGERWYDPDYAFRVRSIQVPTGYEKVLKGSNVGWNGFGERPSGRYPEVNAIIAHARKASGAPKSPKNVHPFVADSVAFIHNGTVLEYSKKLLDCTPSDDSDSMGLLNRYIEKSVPYNLEFLEDAYSEINGGMVCIALAHDGERWVMDLWKNDYNTLYAIKLRRAHEDIGIIWTTDVADFTNALKDLTEKKPEVWKAIHGIAAFPFEPGNSLRIDAATGGFVAHCPFPKETYGKTTVYHAGGNSFHNQGGRILTPLVGNVSSPPTKNEVPYMGYESD